MFFCTMILISKIHDYPRERSYDLRSEPPRCESVMATERARARAVSVRLKLKLKLCGDNRTFSILRSTMISNILFGVF